MALTSLLSLAAVAALHGQLTDLRDGGRSRFDFDQHAGEVIVMHHFAVEVGCDGELKGPTIAGPTFNQMATDYAAAHVQVVDISDMDATEWYQWWITTTTANHPVLMDDQSTVLSQVHSTSGWPEIVIVDCRGEVKYKKHLFATMGLYERELKPIIDAALADCAP